VRAINLTTTPQELDPVNGPGMLAPALESSEGAHERDLEEVTGRERALADAGAIALVDAAGRARHPDPPPSPPGAPGEPDPDAEGGD
jgi:hypothetical protein